LWRRHWPDGVSVVYLAALTTPEKLLWPRRASTLAHGACLDAVGPRGKLLWEAPFTDRRAGAGSSRRSCKGKCCHSYASGSESTHEQGTEKPFTFGGTADSSRTAARFMSWIYSNDNTYYTKDHHPRLGPGIWKTGKLHMGEGFLGVWPAGATIAESADGRQTIVFRRLGYGREQTQTPGLPEEKQTG